MTFKLKWTFVHDELSDLQKFEWLQLEKRSSKLSASGTLAFAQNAQLLIEGSTVFYALGYDDDNLKVALPLVVKETKKFGFKVNYLQVSCHNHFDYFVAAGQSELCEKELVESLIFACKKDVKNWDLFFSRRWYFNRPLPDHLISESYSRQAAYFNLENKHDIAEIMSKKLLKNINRFEKKIAQSDTQLELKIASDIPATEEALKHFYQIETSGWKGKAGSAIGLNKATLDFYNRCWNEFSRTNNSIIFRLFQENICIASGIAYKHDNTIYLHKIAYDESLSKNSPGSILVKHIIEYAISLNEISVICFNTNPPWISRWHPQIDDLIAVQAFNSNPKGIILRIGISCFHLLRRIKRRLKSQP